MRFRESFFAIVAGVVVVTLVCPRAASADSLFTETFESPDYPNGTYSNPAPSGWMVNGTGVLLTVADPDYLPYWPEPNPAPAEGFQFGIFGNDSSTPDAIASIVTPAGATIAGATYTLKVALFDRNDGQSNFSDWQIDLLANDAATNPFTITKLGSTGWFEATTSFTAAETGQSLKASIGLSTTATNQQLIFDNVRVEGPNPADLNGDGQVNLTDYDILLAHWFQNVANGTFGDLNLDGIVSIPDFSKFKTAYNAFNGGGGESLARPAPEPSTIILLAVALPALLALRRHQNIA